MILSILGLLVSFLRTLSTNRFNTEGWSTTIFHVKLPVLFVLLYVYTGSGLPMKSVFFQFAVTFSVNVKPYGGNHITLPPLGPLSQIAKSETEKPGVLDVLQAKFSSENMYFLA